MWVGSRAGLDAVEKRKSLASAGNRTQIPVKEIEHEDTD
jgi:hypothetical protein